MKFGIFLLMQSPDMLSSSQVYNNALEQARLADELGFDYVVLAEHHFSNYGFDPNPLLLVPAIAAQTKQIRIATAVVVLPLRNPLNVAEDIAMLDVLTNGRIEVGFGTGYQQYEFDRFRVPLRENRAIFEEALEVVTRALTEPNFTHDGNYFHVPLTTTLPRPVQEPHPRFWRATSSVESMAKALSHNMKVISGATTSTTERVLSSWHAFQDAVELSGVGWPQDFIVQRAVYMSDSEEDARAQVHHGLWHTRTTRSLNENTLPVDRGRAQVTAASLEDAPEIDFLYEDWLFGTPDMVAAKIDRLTQQTGMNHLNCTFSIGQVDQAKILRSMRLFAEHIMPRYRNYLPDQASYPRGGSTVAGMTDETGPRASVPSVSA